MSEEKGEKKYILAIDHGTSAMKVALADPCGEILAFEYEDTPLYLFPDGGAEQDPDEWWTALIKATNRLLGKGLVPIEQIVAICVSSQWSGTVPVDDNGDHLMNAIIWMDSRGEPYIKKINEGIINISGYGLLNLVRWLRSTGGLPAKAGKDPIAHILYIKHEHPDIYDRTFKFLEPKDYLNLRLTGEFAASFDSIMLHWVTDIRDINNIHYNAGLIKKMGIHREKLPELKQSIDVLGVVKEDVAQALGVCEATKVVVGSPDLHSAIIGSGAVRDYEGHIYIGTSSWAMCHVPFKKTDITHNMASLPSAVPGRYFVANEQETAGACLKFLRDKVLYIDDESRIENPEVYREFDRIVEKVPPGSNGLIFTPWLYGERTPVEDHTIRGGLHNISLSVTRDDMIRAIFEGVAFNTRWLFELVEKFIKRKMDPVNIIGGGAQSDVWCQIFADVLSRTVRQVKDPIMANARGAAFIAAVGLGICSFDDISNLVQYSNIFHPNPENHKLYNRIYSEFLNLYKNNKAMHRRLNK
ncbi:MAG: FGGY-family carbohydrate kinase [Candidatus Thorarchaeota archaeon]|nr:FGGY-family carbohydrate kinase [Candidatus Thorarchaeota archaeon]